MVLADFMFMVVVISGGHFNSCVSVTVTVEDRNDARGRWILLLKGRDIRSEHTLMRYFSRDIL
jgi:hypothetical protein